MRIKNEQQLRALKQNMNPRVRSQLESELLRSKLNKPSRKQQGLANKRKATGSAKLNFCPLPPMEPADRLYQALVGRWGRFLNGGEVLWELMPLPDSGLRLDAALPRYRIGLEMDGWKHHGKYLEGFKRDRRKSTAMAAAGWSLIHVSNEQVNHYLDQVLDQVAMAMECRYPQTTPPVEVLPSGWSRFALQS